MTQFASSQNVTAADVGATSVIVRNEHLQRLFAHAEASHPEECCGLLLGTVVGRAIDVSRVVHAGNISVGDRRSTYQVDWQTLLTCTKASREGDPQIVGVYHSHPDGSTRPSRTDSRLAWVEYAYVILGKTSDLPTCISAWRLCRQAADWVSLQVMTDS